MPSVEQVRPSSCPACRAASRPIGERVGLQGHGVRERQVLGPLSPGAAPEVLVIALRRYRCVRCRAVTTVGPAELLTRRLYSSAAIAWALALFALAQLSPKAIRGLVSPMRCTGATSAARWMTLLRWSAAAAEGKLFRCVAALPSAWRPRRIAEKVAATVASYALPSPDPPSLIARAFAGAARAP